MTPENSRVHAMACFALACTYSAPNEISLYERYIVMACISDARSLTMENLALQVLAMYILEHGHGNLDIAAAQRYINISLENAKFYNNRLRILEISDRLPAIVDSYQAQLSERNIKIIREIAERTNIIETGVEELINARKVANKIEDQRERAITYHDTIAPKMEKIRYQIDKLELIVSDELWTLPKYRELLFIR